MRKKDEAKEEVKIPKKMGRPCKPIDWTLFEDLCAVMCTHEELASLCHISRPALYERVEKQYGEDFPTVYKRFTDVGKRSLRRTQFQMAKKNCSMAIWLGKQYLDQKDRDDKEHLPPNDKMLGHLLDEIKTLKDKINATQRQANPEL